MTPTEFIKAKLGISDMYSDHLNNFSGNELAELIEEFNEIKAHIKEGHVKLDNRPIKAQEWIDYNERYKEWKVEYADRMGTMDAYMSEPNKPNYFRANND